MNDFIQLLITYWKPIIGLLFVIAGFIIALIKKRPISDILTDIYYWSIEAVLETESVSSVAKIDSDVKLARATNYVMQRIADKYPKINVEKYSKMIVKVIEDLLATPHKKG